jgi:hypothetical protein
MSMPRNRPTAKRSKKRVVSPFRLNPPAINLGFRAEENDSNNHPGITTG